MAPEEHLEAVRQAIVDGDEERAVEATRAALSASADPLAILNDGLMAGADVVGQRFETGEYFLPELMLTGRALKSAMAVLEPALKEKYAERPDLSANPGVVVMATVEGDIHDIGKNMVSSMFTAYGFEVHDMGVDVPVKSIIAKAKEVRADIIACSALLTTSMPVMRDLAALLKAMDERENFILMVGGAPVTPAFAKEIGADGTAPNAVQAAQLAQELMRSKR